MERVLANVDAQGGDGNGLGFGQARHGVGSLLLWPLSGKMGSRPDHPILMSQVKHNARNKSSPRILA
jgi:hypothetical protein